MSIKIKASSVTNLTDARYFAAKDVRWMGFCLDETSSAYVKPVIAAAIMEWVEGPMMVGEFGKQDTAEIQNLATQLNLQAIQLSYDVPPAQVRELQHFYIIREIRITGLEDWEFILESCAALSASAEVFLLDFSTHSILWRDIQASEQAMKALRQLAQTSPIIIEISDDATAIAELCAALSPYGISLKGGIEEKTGYKSFDELEEIIETLGRGD